MSKRRKRRKEIWLFTGWRRWALVGLLVLIVGGVVFDGLFGDTLAARAAIRRLEDDDPDARDDLRRMGVPFLSRFESALLAGGRSFEAQQSLSDILLLEPFYARAAIDRAMKSEDAVVRRAAAMVVLMRFGSATAPPDRIDDGALEVLAEWSTDPGDQWLPPSLGFLYLYRDPRVVDFLVPLAELEPGVTPEERARIGETRLRAIRRLSPFAKEDRVAAALRGIVKRENETSRIREEAILSLAAGGRSDPDVYWVAARSPDDLERQAVARNLVAVKDPRILPVLIHLVGDANVSVRREALMTLVRKRSPFVMKEIDYLVEDRYYGIRVDLAMAVGQYRERDRIPFLIRLLRDFDPEVVQAVYVDLTRMTKSHHGFSEIAWTTWGRLPPRERAQKIKDFMNDEKRREAAIARWVEVYPPAPDERDRVPHLIRMLMHRDSGNVERAMKELMRITKRREGFPPELIDRDVPIERSASARLAFMVSDRAELAAEWSEWWKGQ